MNKALEILNERAKELRCIYQVEELMLDKERSIEDAIQELLKIIPPGWQFPSVCEVCITYEGFPYKTPGYKESFWKMSSDLIVENHMVGQIQIVYTQFIRDFGGTQFLPEEQRLLNTIADRLSNFIFHKRLEKTLSLLSEAPEKAAVSTEAEKDILSSESDQHWRWRYRIAERIGKSIDMDRFGIKGLYLIGSTLEATAGPGSDIDLIAHVKDDQGEKAELLRAWMHGYGICLIEMNLMQTGYHSTESVIDLHLITDEDFKMKNSYAVMINSPHGRSQCLRKANEKRSSTDE